MSEAEMPKYQSIKQVWALKIKEIKQSETDVEYPGGSWELIPVLSRYAPIRVSHDWLLKHTPAAGGYYVKYKDGYTSYSPSDPFEEGNILATPSDSYSNAMAVLEAGKRARRTSWPEGQFVYLVPGSTFKVNRPPLLGIYSLDTEIQYQPHIDMHKLGPAGEHICSTWNPTPQDTAAIDWVIFEAL